VLGEEKRRNLRWKREWNNQKKFLNIFKRVELAPRTHKVNRDLDFDHGRTVTEVTKDNYYYFLRSDSENPDFADVSTRFCDKTLRKHCYEDGQCVKYYRNRLLSNHMSLRNKSKALVPLKEGEEEEDRTSDIDLYNRRSQVDREEEEEVEVEDRTSKTNPFYR
jgi:hypothetical protein